VRVFVRAGVLYLNGFASRKTASRDLLHTSLAMPGACSERSNLLQIILAEGVTMTKIQYLKDQAVRAERLARSVMDSLTAERLKAFAAECRAQADTLTANQRQVA